MIEHLELENFTAFKKLDVKFSPKINIMIGENGTGKTNLLKAAYFLDTGLSINRSNPNADEEDLTSLLTNKFLRLFLPLDGKLGKLRHQGAKKRALLRGQFTNNEHLTVNFSGQSKTLTVVRQAAEQLVGKAVFIPTKEMLAFMKGFNSLYEKYGLSFDQTYQDMYLLLELPEMRIERLPERSRWAMAEIESVCGGRFIFYGGGNVTFKTTSTEHSANSMAEGLRKIGALARLLETGAIQPGVSGPLLWDEPEANLNPKLMRLLVEILLDLSRNGQQIVLATHDYALLKWFDLLMDQSKGDHVLFHSLYRSADTTEIGIATTDDYLAIAPNPIDDAFGELINQEIEKEMGGLGK
jgi:ABC-type lipoprotein export system ATPase subunit